MARDHSRLPATARPNDEQGGPRGLGCGAWRCGHLHIDSLPAGAESGESEMSGTTDFMTLPDMPRLTLANLTGTRLPRRGAG